jgi:hypothetical protein
VEKQEVYRGYKAEVQDGGRFMHPSVLLQPGGGVRRRTKLKDEYIISKIKHELQHHRRIKKVIFITKCAEVIEFVK